MPIRDSMSLYRPCSGVMLFNKDGLVFLGRRVVSLDNGESDGRWWHMPQGGIDEGEEARDAALRELSEETNIRSVRLIGEMNEWLYYDLPPELQGRVWGGRYIGQKQKWFAAQFTGSDSEINIEVPDQRCNPEFVEWSWVSTDYILDKAVPFKRDVYRQVLSGFAHFVTGSRPGM